MTRPYLFGEPPSEKAERLGPSMVAATQMLNKILRQRAVEACPDEGDRWPWCLSVLEMLLATYVVTSAPDPESLQERIELTLSHVAAAALKMGETL